MNCCDKMLCGQFAETRANNITQENPDPGNYSSHRRVYDYTTQYPRHETDARDNLDAQRPATPWSRGRGTDG